MSLKDIRSECTDFAALLQPYIDAELSEEELERVGDHLEGCQPCRIAIHEQQWVRTVLRSVERESAPSALRAGILLALDGVDGERATARPEPSWLERIVARMRDLARGGLIMVPAGAAALGLFVLARQGLLPGEEPEHRGPVASADIAAPSGDSKVLEALAELEPRVGFPVQVARPAAEVPRNVQLVSARTAQGSAARLEYVLLGPGQQPTGRRVVDLQTAADAEPPRGMRHDFRGATYFIDRDIEGQPIVRFEVGGVSHLLSLEGEGPLPVRPTDPELSGQDGELAVLLAIADVLRRNGGAPQR